MHAAISALSPHLEEMVSLRDALWGSKAQSCLATRARSSEAVPSVGCVHPALRAGLQLRWGTGGQSLAPLGSKTQLRGANRLDGEFQIGAQQQQYWQGSLR